MQEQILDPLVHMTAERGAFHVALLEAEASEVLPPFGLVSLVTGMSARSSVQMQLANKWYKEPFEAIDISINNMIAMELISLALPPTGDLSMDYIQASASYGIALPGYDTRIYGSGFSTTPGMNQFFIVGVDWQGDVDAILDGCGFGGGDSLAERLETAQTCLDATDPGDSVGGQSVNDDGVLGEQRVYLGAFPSVCGSGYYPVTIGIMALNLESGARTAFTRLTCLP